MYLIISFCSCLQFLSQLRLAVTIYLFIYAYKLNPWKSNLNTDNYFHRVDSATELKTKWLFGSLLHTYVKLFTAVLPYVTMYAILIFSNIRSREEYCKVKVL